MFNNNNNNTLKHIYNYYGCIKLCNVIQCKFYAYCNCKYNNKQNKKKEEFN